MRGTKISFLGLSETIETQIKVMISTEDDNEKPEELGKIIYVYIYPASPYEWDATQRQSLSKF